MQQNVAREERFIFNDSPVTRNNKIILKVISIKIFGISLNDFKKNKEFH